MVIYYVIFIVDEDYMLEYLEFSCAMKLVIIIML